MKMGDGFRRRLSEIVAACTSAEPPSRDWLAAGASLDFDRIIDELKDDRDRWVELAAANRRTAERVTAERDAAWAEIERLKDELNRLSRGWVGGVIENFNEDNR